MAEWTAAQINDLPDSSFAYIEPGGTKDGEGKTTPRSLRHFPYKDASGKVDRAHLANAMARAKQSPFGEKAMPKLMAAEKEVGVGMGKAAFEMKAEPMGTAQLDRWLKGEIPRRALVVPFGGPIPSQKSSLGVDLDGEWFDQQTDLFGPYAQLRATRERLVDWHHDDEGVPEPVARMKGAILGRIVLDEDPEADGYWADWWAKAGERRLALVAALEKRAVPLFGSSQAVYKKASADGHIDEWPLIRHTITTSPQNTLAVVPPLKAVLTADVDFDEVGLVALKAALVGLDYLTPDLRTTEGRSLSDEAAKAGRVLSRANEARFRQYLRELHEFLDQLAPPLPEGQSDE